MRIFLKWSRLHDWSDEAHSIMNVTSHSLSVNYWLCVLTAAHLKTGDGDLPPIMDPALLMRWAWELHAINCTALLCSVNWSFMLPVLSLRNAPNRFEMFPNVKSYIEKFVHDKSKYLAGAAWKYTHCTSARLEGYPSSMEMSVNQLGQCHILLIKKCDFPSSGWGDSIFMVNVMEYSI